jgi:hypothetical protein
MPRPATLAPWFALALLAGHAWSGEIQAIDLGNFGPQAGSTRTIYDRPAGETGRISYGEIGWDPLKAVDPGITVFNNTPVYGNPAQQIIADCVMAPRTAALTIGGDKQCNDTFQSHKRYKMSATAFGPIDLVFTVRNVDAAQEIRDKNGNLVAVDQDATRNVYRMIGKLNNHTGKRMNGFRVELGHGLGAAFVPHADLASLRISLREEGDTDPANDLGANGMAEFPGGLFYGPADDKHTWGFFSSERAGFSVDQTQLKTGAVSFGSEALSQNYLGLFGKWLPIDWVPTGVFFDHDGNPATDADARVWFDGSKWIAYRIDPASGARTELILPQDEVDALLAQPASIWNDDGDAPPIAPTDPAQTLGGTPYARWDAARELYVLADGSGTRTNDEMALLLSGSPTLERRPGYLSGPIEDLANLNLNYFVEVGDISGWPGFAVDTAQFTLRITPLAAAEADQTLPAWMQAPATPDAPPTPISPADPLPPEDGGGCSMAAGPRPLDPTLPLLALVGLVGWTLRRVRRD